MAKRLFFLAVGALALTACTSEDVIEDVAGSRNVIKFENVVNKPSRADLTSKNLKKFNVYGFYTTPGDANTAEPVFIDVPVTRQDDGTWVCGETRHWVPDAKYYFYAYSCGDVTTLTQPDFGTISLNMNSGVTAAERPLVFTNYICDHTHQHDLIFASNTGATETDKFAGIIGKDKGQNDYVSLQFKHLLSKVKARFTSKFPSEYEVVISNVQIRNIRNTGTYNSNSTPGGWVSVSRPEGEQPYVTLLGSGATVKVKNELNAEKAQSFVDTNTAYVLPYVYSGSSDADGSSTNTWVNIYFKVELYLDSNKVMERILTGKFNPTWVEGCSYVYNVELSGDAVGLEAITFVTGTDESDEAILDWTTDETPVITIDK